MYGLGIGRSRETDGDIPTARRWTAYACMKDWLRVPLGRVPTDFLKAIG
jgi:hypothetical protein